MKEIHNPSFAPKVGPLLYYYEKIIKREVTLRENWA